MCKHILIRNFASSDLETIHEFASRSYENDGFGAIIRDHSGLIRSVRSLNKAAFYMDVGATLASGMVRDLVLHHRQSTNGSGIDYAHPFQYGGYYMTHNGVVSVPGTHDVKTTNDTEALLHHFVKHDFSATDQVSGYFSCFAMSVAETVLVVDSTAPVYSDPSGRVYCSHNLGEWSKIERKRIRWNVAGDMVEDSEIVVKASDYGRAWKGASLGLHDSSWYTREEWSKDSRYFDDLPDAYNVADYDPRYRGWSSDWDTCDDFLQIATYREIERLERLQSPKKRRRAIISIAESAGLKLSEATIQEIISVISAGAHYSVK